MKTIFTIFKNDIKSIVKYFFVLVIVAALGVLPSLYAWINIYANWDPYTDTANVQIALASRDSGIKLQDGTRVNSADEVIASIRDDEDIGYRPLDSADDAVAGVESGRFYAAVVFEDGFTYDMHHFEEAVGDQEPKITYYTNAKINPIAGRITDVFAEDIQNSINEKYVKQTLTQYFEDTGEVLEEADTEEPLDDALAQLTGARDAIHDYNAAVSRIRTNKGDVTGALDKAQRKLDQGRSDGNADAAKAKKRIEQAKAAIQDVSGKFDDKTEKLDAAVADLKQTVDGLQSPVDEADREKALEKTDRVLTILQDLRSMLPEEPKTTAGRVAADTLDVMISRAEHIKTLLKTDPASPEIPSDLDAMKNLIQEDLIPSFDLMLSDIESALERAKPLLKSVGGVLDDIDPVIGSAGSSVESLDATLAALQETLGPLEVKLDDVIAKVQNAKDGEKEDVLADLLGIDAEHYSSFFTDLVKIDTEEFYKPAAYGAAMTPFYTIIALWVGGVMLVTLMNCSVDRRKYPDLTEPQGFFGRFLIFFLIGQIQAAVAVAGDIFLLHCSPVHPWLMWVAAAATSMAFVSLIYALTLAFSDIGRAAVVVIMIVQIAGSSGTFPIEILPDLYQKIYLFFPFPYGINAMREAVCGLYQYDFVKYLAQLMVFFLFAAAIGIFVRKPFTGVKQFMYDKMKETGVM